jgi:putative Ca2+/H+ antiporter (TMEM165/GDT1 family)
VIEDFLFPFIAVGLAELGDKTQLCILLMSTKTDKHLQFLLGAVLAFFLVDGIAVLAGSWVTTVIPTTTLKAASGIVFIVFGLLTLRDKDDGECDTKPLKNPFFSAFTLIFLAELGDKTQIAAALFAVKYDALMVLLGVMAALTLLSVAAVYLGKLISGKINRGTLSKVAGIVFILVGLSFFII